MAGISDKAIKGNYAENKYRYNAGTELQSKEFLDGGGLELYTTDHRLYDPQLGRFAQVDAYAHVFENWSPYNYANDDPTLLNDPTGLQVSDSSHPQERKTVTITGHRSNTSNLIMVDLRPVKKNPNYVFGSNTPFYIHYTKSNHWDWRILQRDKPLFKALAFGVTLIPVAKGIRMAYGCYKLLQGIEDAEAIPETAERVADNALEKNGAALRGWKGGGKFENAEGTLPTETAEGKPVTYREYDVWPRVPGQNRGAERVVVGSDRSAYYTDDHYQTFTQIRGN